jgi:hypothetical protein
MGQDGFTTETTESTEKKTEKKAGLVTGGFEPVAPPAVPSVLRTVFPLCLSPL